MEAQIPKQEFSIRKLGTKSVTLYPTKAQIVRNVNGVSLKPGPNQVTIIGLTPTCDEHSIKVDGTGAATITDLTVELVPNPEVYADIYPDEDESDNETSEEESDAEAEKVTGRLKEVADETAKLENEAEQQYEIQNNVSRRLTMVDLYLTNQACAKNAINLSEVTDGYRDERAKIFAEKTTADKRIQEIGTRLGELAKEQHRLTRESRKAKAKAEKEKAKAREKEERKRREKAEEKARIRKERVKFWPKKVFKITISLEAPSGFTPASSRRSSIDSTVKVPEVTKSDDSFDTAEINLLLSYITYSASWTPRYDLSLNTVTNTGTLDYSAELTNVTSETWRDAKVVLSTSQSSYQGLSDTIPTLQPWHIRLVRGDGYHGYNAALQSSDEINQAHQTRKELPPQVYQPRNELFGIDRDVVPLAKHAFRPPQDVHYEAASEARRLRSSAPPQHPAPMAMASLAAPTTRGFGSMPPPPPGAAPSGLFSSSSKKKQVSRRGFGGQAHGGGGAEEYENEDEEEGGYYADDADGATLGGIIEPALLFEESSFEESGLTTTYDLPSLKTLSPVSTATKHKIARVEFKAVVFSHIVVPKLRADAFLKAKLRNTSKITLLKGSAGLTVDGSFLGQSTIPRCTAGDSFTLNLGVDPAVTVGYSRPSVQRSSSGLFTKENCEVFTRVATLTNTKSNTIVELTLLEQVPISEEERLKIEIMTPRGLRIGGDAVLAGAPKDGDKPRESIGSLAAGKSALGAVRAGVYGKDSKWGSAVATAKKGGEINFNVKINPGRGCKLILEYEATYPGGESVVSA
ncbi:hypothetical protein V499_03577 [Pseudogymnoascus sp. VKM F-103]|uniref:Mucoidy inhibitor A n=1 Tax=Pseudogymnoascus verrucosus TaxID=342668 RepID=A0A1B8GWT7_9PEZI|nr:uncharacterized protein VE01_01522 [Pseudogymnoascus verrucosus]KFY76886.1 hypothetical protein V499_03577 [Pseudogymnoascus sp. VKM F-103]OBU00305.1 hypothetical protein VE01_01522 [Pseudogymnoascus verrucosus]